MTRRRAGIVIVVVTVALMSWFLAPAREQLAWWWAESRNGAADYKEYLDQYPEGHHLFQADLHLRQRDWDNVKNSMIRQAYHEEAHPDAGAEAAYTQEKKLRRDNFFWKEATNFNTVQGYKEYLQQYPQGIHAAEATNQIELLGRQAFNTAPATP